jgi:hypothetical protein
LCVVASPFSYYPPDACERFSVYNLQLRLPGNIEQPQPHRRRRSSVGSKRTRQPTLVCFARFPHLLSLRRSLLKTRIRSIRRANCENGGTSQRDTCNQAFRLVLIGIWPYLGSQSSVSQRFLHESDCDESFFVTNRNVCHHVTSQTSPNLD